VVGTTRAAIIAGGKGTRIRSITGDQIPKALVPVAGQPIVFRQLQLLKRYGITEVAVLAGMLASELEAGVRPEAERLGLHLEFFVEEKPLGTAGGLLSARSVLGDNHFLALYGDVAVEMDLVRFQAFHAARNATATIVAHPNYHPHESDLLEVDQNGRVRAILLRDRRKPGYYHNLVPAALYCLEPDALDFIEPDREQDFIQDVFPRMIAAGVPVHAYNTPEYLRDMGTLRGYEKVEEDIESGRVARMNALVKRPAVFFDQDGVLNDEVHIKGLTRPEELELIDHAARAVKLVNDAGWLAILVTNRPQIAKGFVTIQESEYMHAKLETLLGYEHALLDRIYYCPHHPERGFTGEVPELKIDCDCRKPKPGMLLRACEELPVDLSGSSMIGDSWRDVGAARAVGVDSYGVRTGYGCRSCTGDYTQDLIFENVFEAARFAVMGIPEAERLAAEIAARLDSGRQPFLVGIAGLARSGKSVFAHSLSRTLRRKGLQAARVSLDQWIVPRNERGGGMSSEERSQVEGYPELVTAANNGGELVAPGYHAATSEAAPPVHYDLGGARVVILDGVFACHHSIRDQLNLALYIEAPESVLVSRMQAYYAWKGDSREAIAHLLEMRKKEEWPAVERQRVEADSVVHLGRGHT
jgi:histidinol-phosphate phosphatase family protein